MASMEDQAEKVGCRRRRRICPATALPLAHSLLAAFIALQFREQKKNNGLLLVAASRGYLADVSSCLGKRRARSVAVLFCRCLC